MESSDHYNFSLFSPRNLQGKKNRNVMLSMILVEMGSSCFRLPVPSQGNSETHP
jgi:hypothetical protein